MKPWVVWLSMFLGVLLGAGAVWLDKQSAEPVVAARREPEQTPIAEEATLTVAPDWDFVDRVQNELPLLYLQAEDGRTTVVGSYYVDYRGHLVLGDLRGIWPDRFTRLIAIFSDHDEVYLAVNFDLQSRVFR